MYGPPKQYKAGIPVRPILSRINSAKFVSELKPVEEALNTRCIRLSSCTFLGSHTASFDLSSLFTNIPVEDTVDIIINKVNVEP